MYAQPRTWTTTSLSSSAPLTSPSLSESFLALDLESEASSEARTSTDGQSTSSTPFINPLAPLESDTQAPFLEPNSSPAQRRRFSYDADCFSRMKSSASSISSSSVSSLFSALSSSTRLSSSPPEHFYAGLPHQGYERTQYLHAIGQVYGTFDLGNGRRGAISGPSANYYHGKYERNTKGKSGDHKEYEEGGEDEDEVRDENEG